MADLAADHKFPILTPAFTDEVGNPVSPPADAVVVYSISDPAVLALTDNGDGTGEVAAVALGSSNLHVDVSTGGQVFSGDEMINVVAGAFERVAINLGPAEEITPDV